MMLLAARYTENGQKVIKSRKSVVKRNRKIDWQITIGMWLFAFLL